MQAKIQIKIAKGKKELDDVRALLKEYAWFRNYDKAMGDFEKELLELPGDYQMPDGVLLIGYLKDESAGCVALRKNEEGICEMKRMFVSEKCRGNRVGELLVNEVLFFAKKLNYKKIRLDTHPWMTTAQNIYRRAGFKEIAPYNNNPTEGIRFFEKEI